MTETPAPRRLTCARCSAEFDCGLSGDCWCTAEHYRLPMTAAPGDDCVCPGCLRKAAAGLAEGSRTVRKQE